MVVEAAPIMVAPMRIGNISDWVLTANAIMNINTAKMSHALSIFLRRGKKIARRLSLCSFT